MLYVGSNRVIVIGLLSLVVCLRLIALPPCKSDLIFISKILSASFMVFGIYVNDILLTSSDEASIFSTNSYH